LGTALFVLFVFFPLAGFPLLVGGGGGGGGGEPTQGFPVYNPRLTGVCGEGLCNVPRAPGKKSKYRRHHALPGKFAARSRFRSDGGGSSRCIVLVPGELFPPKRIALCSREPWLQVYNPHLIRFLVQSGVAVVQPIVGIQKIIPIVCDVISFFEHLIIRDYCVISTVT